MVSSNTMDSHLRTIMKTVSWRVMGMLFTAAVAWIVTRKIGFAASIGVIDFVVKGLVYYVHERVWNKLELGRQRRPEYEI